MAPAWFFVAGTGILVLAVANRDLAARRSTHDLLRNREALIDSLGVVTDQRLTQLPLYQLLDELLGRARTVMRADTAAVLLHDRTTRRLEPAASSGVTKDQDPVGVEVSSGLLGRVATARRGAVYADAPADRGLVPGMASVVVVPLVAEGHLVGVLQVGTRQRQEFGEDDLRLLQVVADRVAVAVDASRLDREAQRARLAVEGARQRLALLADAGAVLARSFDRVEAMAEALAVALVPQYIDWFAYHGLDDDGSPRLVAWHASEEVATGADGGGDWDELVAATVALDGPTLAWGDELLGPENRVARELGLTSVAVTPVSLGAQALGTITFGTAGRRRGLRPGDVDTGEDLAARFAVAVERVVLAEATQRSAVRAARHAAQLQRLTDGAFAINASLTADQLAVVVAEQAALILDADAATVDLGDADGPRTVRAGAERDPAGAHVATAALFHGSASPSAGALTVARAGAPFGAEDEAILASLAQIASVALANARLYGDLQESQTRLRALYDASPVAIVELDPTGRGVRWNRAAEAMFEWPAHVEGAASVELPEPARVVSDRVLAGADAQAVDVVLGDDISSIAAELVVVPLREQEQEIGGVVLAAVDVTERKQVAEQLQLAQRMEAMATMAGGVAHDFNNVLMVITGYVDLILRREIDDELRGDLDAMRAAANRAAELTRKLLTIGRRQVVQPQRVDVDASLGSLREVLDVMVGNAVTLDLRIGAPPPVLIDPAQFEQLVLNLALNARDAMPEGGTLTITADGDGGHARITVSDTGEGMEPVALDHCFEPFFTTKDRTKGTGLGLSTVYGVVTQAGGEITVDSVPGAGTTFRVSLPATTEAAATMAGPTAPVVSLRVLVVDDDDDVRAVVADMLELEGHEVAVAADGAAALVLLPAFGPHVLLTDVVMPGMRGPDLAERAMAVDGELRVVLMSSHVDDELELATPSAGVRFLAKPFSPDALVEVLAAAVADQPSKR